MDSPVRWTIIPFKELKVSDHNDHRYAVSRSKRRDWQHQSVIEILLVKIIKIPQCRCDVFLQPRFSSESLQLDCYCPGDEAVPSWYFPGWQKQQRLHVLEEGPLRLPGPPEYSYKTLWPSPNLAPLWPHDWVDPGSTQGLRLDAGAGTGKILWLLQEVCAV